MRFPVWLVVLVSLAAIAVSPGGSAQSAGQAPGGTLGWRVVTAGAKVPFLTDVAALSPTDVWAVGSDTGAENTSPVIVHWDGRRLRRVDAFRPDAHPAVLTAIAAVSPRDVWAVGSEGENDPGALDPSGRPVAVHWDGKAWKRIALPRVAPAAALGDVVAVASNDVWAVGFASSRFEQEVALALHWDGARWRVVDLRGLAPENSELNAIAATSSHDVWAVGCRNTWGYVMHEREDLALHWNGSRWEEERGLEGHECLYSVDARTPRDVWSLSEVNSWNDYVLHWNGSRQTQHEVFPGEIFTLAAPSPTSVWGVGNAIVHWDGNRWTSSKPPGKLFSLSALSATDIWAVGPHVIARYSR